MDSGNKDDQALKYQKKDRRKRNQNMVSSKNAKLIEKDQSNGKFKVLSFRRSDYNANNSIENFEILKYDGSPYMDQQKLNKRSERFKNTNGGRSEFGFISRGEDNRLQKSSLDRERFFNSILASFIKYCNDNTSSTLNQNLSKLVDRNDIPSKKSTISSCPTIESIISSLRKLREALLTVEPDEFTKKVFLFSIRITSSIGHYQTYIPSISFLLTSKSFKLLSELEIREISTLLVLHVSHFNKDNSRALRYYFRYLNKFDDRKTLDILNAWIRKDYYSWIKLYNTEMDNSKSFIMKYGIEDVLEHMLYCINKSYFTISLQYLEELLPNGILFDTLIEKYNVTWRKEENGIVVRERKVK